MPVWTGQRVERTNSRGRHRYCEPFKAWIVETALKPGVSTAGLAMRNQINANQLRRWVLLQRKREAAAAVPRLLAVTVAPEPAHTTASDEAAQRIEIEVAGAIVRVRAGIDVGTLRTVLEALRLR